MDCTFPCPPPWQASILAYATFACRRGMVEGVTVVLQMHVCLCISMGFLAVIGMQVLCVLMSCVYLACVYDMRVSAYFC